MKTIKIDGKDIKFSANAAITYLYKNQFGHDLLALIMPVVSDVLAALDEVDSEELDLGGYAIITDNLYRIEIVDLQNIIWSMAKLADDTIPDPIHWYAQFDSFPLLDVLTELLPLLLSSMVTKKKLTPQTIQQAATNMSTQK